MATVDVGYCTVEDVRQALQEADSRFGDRGAFDSAFVKAAILAESERIQETTNRHWYAPDGLETDDGDDPIAATEPLTHDHDEQDIPAGPHSDHVQRFRSRRSSGATRQPQRFGGPYTRVMLQRRDVRELTELLIRQQTGSVTDWVGRSDRDAGRGEDYYLQVDDATGITHLYLHTGSLPALSDYEQAVVASYEYGVDEVPTTVRQATASFAGAHLLRDDESAIGIPDDGQLVNIDTKADKLQQRGERLLDIHL